MMKDFNFSVPLAVRVSELNYGAHVGYQHFLTYFQEARIAYLKQWEYTELDIEGTGMIVAEANCRYQQELFMGDSIVVGCRISEIKTKRFTFQYCIERHGKPCAKGYTHNMCYDYDAKKVIGLPVEFIRNIKAFEVIAL